MKRKLTRQTLDELAQTMKCLTTDEQKNYVGGKVILVSKNGTMSSSHNADIAGTLISGYKDMEEDSENTYFCVMGLAGEESHIHKSTGTVTSVENYGESDSNYTLQGSAINIQTLEFLSKTTNVEWGMLEDAVQGEGESKVPSRLFTSGNSSSVDVYGMNRDENGKPIPYTGFDSIYHTHPQGSDPSEIDDGMAKKLKDYGVTKNYVVNPLTGKVVPY